MDRLFPNLPPDPGEEGKRTLEGIDADGDGVRDDVQRAIYRLEPRDERKRRAMLQYAKALQQMMLAGTNQEAYFDASDEAFYALICIDEVSGKHSSVRPEPAIEAEITIETVEYLFYNTEARVLADLEAEALIPSGAYKKMPDRWLPGQTTGFCE
ncbi:hypothetical protein [Thermostichus vulcanus]|uniref:Uncharacterized protein n=1 Tax=Thermostichus vulcanus str. 'Rupite' TaxID=2813851 RepID=A0ABT0CFP7_THEVL|nr:hypothetical protein [Thermostichus vulcanus]MCJ2544611.1 hypothetical protein [Thermostichus vulcanus str. 'Rupite']